MAFSQLGLKENSFTGTRGTSTVSLVFFNGFLQPCAGSIREIMGLQKAKQDEIDEDDSGKI